ncbi:MAG: hypothetical protein IJH71_09535 [Eubacterium sp.]|nr:hypothetical protein [Eubacterium sp.]
MIDFTNLEEWTKTYFSNPENITKSEKACERYDRILVKNVRQMMLSGEETIEIEKAKEMDPGKRLEKARYEYVPARNAEGKKGRIRVDLLDRTAEFVD